MRKTLFIAVVAIVAMTSCSQNEIMVEPESPDNAIVFRPIIGKQTKTRAAETTGDIMKTDANGYKSIAYVATTTNTTGSSGDFADINAAPTAYFDEAMTWTDPVWAASKTLYWPGEGKMSVFSYFPGKVGDSSKTKIAYTAAKYESSTLTYPSLAFTVSDALAEQVDLIAANDMNQVKAEPVKDLKVNFKHILSQLYFKAKTADDSYQVRVKSITVAGATTSATFTYDGSATIGTWTTPTNTQSYKYRENVFPADATDPDPQTYIGATATLIDSEGNQGSLMILPQVAGNDFKLTVVYDIYTLTNQFIAKDVEKSAQMDDLNMGKKYAYVLTLPTDGVATPITFAIEVSGWDDAEGTVEQSFETHTLSGEEANFGTGIAALVNDFNTSMDSKEANSTYTHAIKIADTETSKLTQALTIDLSSVSSDKLGADEVVVLDFSGLTNAPLSETFTVTVTTGSNWTATPASLNASGVITLKKAVVEP